jgi:hypothetical protein
LPGPLHLKGETRLESTRTQAGLILDERIAPLSRLVTLFLLRWTGLPHLGRRLANEATGRGGRVSPSG